MTPEVSTWIRAPIVLARRIVSPILYKAAIVALLIVVPTAFSTIERARESQLAREAARYVAKTKPIVRHAPILPAVEDADDNFGPVERDVKPDLLNNYGAHKSAARAYAEDLMHDFFDHMPGISDYAIQNVTFHQETGDARKINWLWRLEADVVQNYAPRSRVRPSRQQCRYTTVVWFTHEQESAQCWYALDEPDMNRHIRTRGTKCEWCRETREQVIKLWLWCIDRSKGGRKGSTQRERKEELDRCRSEVALNIKLTDEEFDGVVNGTG
jgi:hypothetical protein